jgi:hypothetical protein
LSIEEEVFDVLSIDLTHTIGQPSINNKDGKHWLLRPDKFSVYGLSHSVMAAPIEVLAQFKHHLLLD